MSQPLTLIPPERGLESAPSFDQARRFYAEAGHCARKSIGYLVLVGVELIRIHRRRQVRAGRPSINSLQSRELTWGELIQREMGFGEEKARRCMILAEAVGKRAEVIRAALLRDADSPEDREALMPVTLKLCDGQTFTQLMLDLGVLKKPSGNPNPVGGERGDAPHVPLEDMAQRDVWAVMEPLGMLAGAANFTALINVLPLNPEPESNRLASLHPLREALEEWLAAVKAAIAQRKAEMRKN